MTLDEALKILNDNGYVVILNEGILTKAAAIGTLATGLALGNSNIPELQQKDDSFGKNTIIHQHYRHNFPSNKYGIPTDYKIDGKYDTYKLDVKDEIELTKKKILATPDSTFKEYGKKHIDVIARLITNAANKYNIDIDGLLAIACVESNFDNNASSGKGAKGIMQLTKVAAEDIHNRISKNDKANFDFSSFEGLEKNIYSAAKLVSDLSVRRNNVWEMIFATYNGGTEQATQYRYFKQGKQNSLSKETKNYVNNCIKMYKYYKHIEEI